MAGVAGVLGCAALLASQAGPGKAGGVRQLTVYTAQASYSLAAREREGQLYIGLLDLVEPLGATSASVNGKEWKLSLHDNYARFTEGASQAEVHGNIVDMGGKFLVEDNRPLVPLKASLPLLSSLFEKLVEFHPAARRLFVGSAATRFLAEMNKTKSSLTLTFTQPVNPAISQEQDKIRIVFQREPLVSKTSSQSFADKNIRSLNFAEDNGAALLTVIVGTAMNASLGSDGKSILIQPVNPPGAGTGSAPASSPQTSTAQASTPPASNSPTSNPQASAPAANASPSTSPGNASANASPGQAVTLAPGQERPASEFLVVIDAGHGGEDRGALLDNRIAEKDLTLSLARRLKAELQNRGIAAHLVRDGDVTLSLDQRAEIGNGQHASIYLAFHAGPPGGGIRVYAPALTSTLASTPASPGGGQPLASQFLPWESAQLPYLGRSQILAGAVAAELGKKDFQAASLRAPVRPLNNIMAPAIAVELAPDPENLQNLANAKLQAAIAAGIASGIVQARAQMEARP